MNKKKDNSNLMMTLLKGRTLFVLIILFIFFSIKADSFCTVNSLLLVCKHVAQYGILGIGMTYVIITGGIDLSVGSVVGLVGMIARWSYPGRSYFKICRSYTLLQRSSYHSNLYHYRYYHRYC